MGQSESTPMQSDNTTQPEVNPEIANTDRASIEAVNEKSTVTANDIATSDIIVDQEPKRKIVISEQGKALLVRELLKAEQANKLDTQAKTLRGNLITRCAFDAQRSNLQELVLENKMLSESLEKYKTMYFNLHKLVDELQVEVETSIDEVTENIRLSNNKSKDLDVGSRD